MENTVQKIPFLRPTIALAFGIFTGSVFDVQIYYLIGISIFLLSIIVLINLKFNYRHTTFFGIGLHLLYFSIGFLTFETYNQKPTFLYDGIFVGTILEKPQEKKNSYQSLLQISAVKSENTTNPYNEKLLVYFAKTEDVNQLSTGDNIVFSPSPQTVKNYGNPYEFDYKKYLEQKKIYRQVYLNSTDWKKTEIESKFSVIVIAEQFREKLLKIYRDQHMGKNELEILSALTLGYKRGLDPETKRVFSNAGAMHILAVSGLHVGIVFWIITLLFGKIRKQKNGKLFFIILSIFSLWAYAFITGLSPSVMRAATMFTIFVVGDNINRKANSYNSMAASALFLLLINPNNLFEVGFQLSYAAVFGILFLQPKLSKLIRVKNKMLNFVWNLTTISIAAQIGTFPITSFYFNQFPSYFLLTNLIVIPAAMLLIPLGISLLLFYKIPILSLLISKTLQFIISFCYSLLARIEQFPFSVQEISTTPIQAFLLIGILLSLFLYLQSYSVKYIKTSLVFVLFLCFSVFYMNIKQNNSSELIVYNTSEKPAIQMISGKDNYVITEFSGKDSSQILSAIKNTTVKKHLHQPVYILPKDTFGCQHLLFQSGFIFFKGKTIIMDKSFSNSDKSIQPDFIINPINISTLEDYTSDKTTIITNKRFKQNSKLFSGTIYQIPFQGAFTENW